MSRGSRIRIGKGIYKDVYGLAGVVKVGRLQRERRWPTGTDKAIIQKWREETKVKLRGRQPAPVHGHFSKDIDAYKRHAGHLASWPERLSELNAWRKQMKDIPRGAITRELVLQARRDWLAAKVKPKTINNRIHTLRHLFRALDGHDAETPCDRITPLHVHKTPPQYIDPALVLAVDATLQAREQAGLLRDAKTRARFRVLATTGKRPSELMRAKPADVDLQRRVWIVRDGKGGWSPGLYLNDDMLAAWQLFVEAKAWGKYETSAFARTIREAGWPAGVRPYNLRHSTWIEATERGADMADVQLGAGHKRLETTRTHYTGVRASRMQRLSELLEGRFGAFRMALPAGSATIPNE